MKCVKSEDDMNNITQRMTDIPEFKQYFDDKTEENRLKMVEKHVALLEGQKKDLENAMMMTKSILEDINPDEIPTDGDCGEIYHEIISPISKFRIYIYRYFETNGEKLDFFERQPFFEYVDQDFNRHLDCENCVLRPLPLEVEILVSAYDFNQYRKDERIYSDEMTAILNNYSDLNLLIFKWCAQECFDPYDDFSNINFDNWWDDKIELLGKKLGYDCHPQIVCILLIKAMEILCEVYGPHFNVWKGLNSL